MTPSDAIVYVVDDDALVRGALEQLVKSVGLKAEVFASAQELLDVEMPDVPSCLISDMRMPGLSGHDLQEELKRRGNSLPIIIITGHGTVSMSVRAMKAGAVDFLEKPFEDQELLDAIQHAIERNGAERQAQMDIAGINKRIESLTPREKEILVLVTTGKLNKQIAFDLELSENTVKSHRARIMRKMAVGSIAELVLATEKVGFHSS